MKYEEFKTAEEYLDWLFLSNRGTENFVKKDDLKRLAQSYKLPFTDTATKEELYNLILSCVTHRELARKFNAGVSSYEYQHKFNISGEEVKRMERLGFISITGQKTFHAYGKYLKAPLYDVFEFYLLTPEYVQEILRQNPKGTKKTAQKSELKI